MKVFTVLHWMHCPRTIHPTLLIPRASPTVSAGVFILATSGTNTTPNSGLGLAGFDIGREHYRFRAGIKEAQGSTEGVWRASREH